MSSAHALPIVYDLYDLPAAGIAALSDEISSVRLIPVFDLEPGVEVDPTALDRRLDLEIGVDIDARITDRATLDPAPIYARPYNLVGGERCQFPLDCYLGTRFDGGIIESALWEQEIRAAGASEPVIAQCRRYLSSHAL